MSFHKLIRKTLTALVMCLVLVPFTRYISPVTVLEGSRIYLAWLPLSIMISLLLIFGRYAIAPLFIGATLAFSYSLNLPFIPLATFIFCLLAPLLLAYFITRYYLGALAVRINE